MGNFKLTTDRMMMLFCLVVGLIIAFVVSKIDDIEPVELKSVSQSLTGDPFLEQVKRYSGKGSHAYVNPSRRLGVFKEVVTGDSALIEIGEKVITVQLAGIIAPHVSNTAYNDQVAPYKVMGLEGLKDYAQESMTFWRDVLKAGDDVILDVSGLGEGNDIDDIIKDNTIQAVVFYRAQSSTGRPKMAQINRDLVKAGLAVPTRWAKRDQVDSQQSLPEGMVGMSRRSDYTPEFFRAWRVKRGMFAHKAFH